MSDTLLIDVSWTKPSPKAVKAAGYSGVIGYLSNDPTKDLSAAQAKAYRKAGLTVGLVFETVSGEAVKGSGVGQRDRVQAEREAAARGYPSGCVIFYAVDFDASPVQVLPYFSGVGPGVAYPSGVYGSQRVVDAVLAERRVRFGWQTVAWSNGKVSGRAHMLQRGAKTRPPIANVKGSAYDEDVLLVHLPLWGSAAPKPTPPTPVVKPTPLSRLSRLLAVRLTRLAARLTRRLARRDVPLSSGETVLVDLEAALSDLNAQIRRIFAIKESK